MSIGTYIYLSYLYNQKLYAVIALPSHLSLDNFYHSGGSESLLLCSTASSRQGLLGALLEAPKLDLNSFLDIPTKKIALFLT